MSCSPFDLKDYVFEELARDERRSVEQHVAACVPCREELNALSLTGNILRSIPDEEPPRRIAFVSDKVFEPNWWQRIWHSGPRLGFVSSCLLAAAIAGHGYLTPAPQPASLSKAPLDHALIEKQVQERLDAAVAKAVAQVQKEQSAKLLDAFDSRIEKMEKRHQEDLVAVGAFWSERAQKLQGLNRRAAFQQTSVEDIQ